jgi:hypothetical protein
MNRVNSSAGAISAASPGSFAELVDRLENNFRNLAAKRLHTMTLNPSAEKPGIRQRTVGAHANTKDVAGTKIPQQGDISVRVRGRIRCRQPIREKIDEALRLRFRTCVHRTRAIPIPTWRLAFPPDVLYQMSSISALVNGLQSLALLRA